MAATEALAPSDLRINKAVEFLSKNRLAILLAAIAATCMGIWYYRVRRNAPERIMDVASGSSVVGVHDGKLYIAIQSRKKITIWKVDPKNPSGRRVFWERGGASERDVAAMMSLSLDDQGIQYASYRPTGRSASGSATGAAFGSYPRGYAVAGKTVQLKYARVEVSPKEMEQSGAVPVSNLGSYLITRKPFESLENQTITFESRSDRSITVKDRTYWIESRQWTNVPRKFLPHLEGNVFYNYDFPPCNRLMVSRKGADPEFTGHLIGNSTLKAGSRGIYWTEPGSKTGERVLCSLSAGEKQAARIQGYKGSWLPEEFGDKAAWIEPASTPGSAGLSTLNKIVLKYATLPSGDPQTIATLDTGNVSTYQAMSDVKLQASDGRLYLFVPNWSGMSAQKETVPQGPQIYEIVFDKEPHLALRSKLPVGASFRLIDGGYCYYFVDEDRENVWDWSKEGLAQRSVTVLFRRRLQE